MSGVKDFTNQFHPTVMVATKTSRKEKAEDTRPAADASEKRKPIHTFRVDEINVSVWSRQHEVRGELRTFYSYTLERSYRDKLGKYGYSRNFDFDSSDRLIEAVQRAKEYLQTLVHPESMLPSEEAASEGQQ